MATWIPNQPVFFGEVNNDCSCDPALVPQLVDNTDTTQFQFKIAPCDGAVNLIYDEHFADPGQWNIGNNWSVAYNQMCHFPGDTDTSSSLISLDPLKYYKIEVIVDSISGGTLTVYLGLFPVGIISAPGTYIFYGTPVLITVDAPIVFEPSQDASFCMSFVSVFEILKEFKFAIYNSNNGYEAAISYTNNPAYFKFSQDSVTVNIIWSELGLSNGCYYICLLDPCINSHNQNKPVTITNEGFTGSATGWVLGGGVAYSSNSISWASNGTAYQLIFPAYGYNYTIKIDAILSGTIKVYFGSELITTITTTGVHEITGVPQGDLNLTLIMTGTGSIDSITANNAPFSSYTCNSQSNTFKLSDYSNSCTTLINGCNNEDGMGFVFIGSSFSPRLRLSAKLKQSKYPVERTIYEDSLGEKKNIYYKRRKAKYLCIDLQPEYVHDFLSVAMGFDNFFIDSVAYFFEDNEYIVEYPPGSDDLGQIKLLVSEKIQNTVNINCSDDTNNCNLG